ncbi:MAG: T9SS type A sorting domain-containing protein [Flavobacteriales bacterium]|nr:T9SS type A sorting domain-containing protein [Flavobacteriales bacterium]
MKKRLFPIVIALLFMFITKNQQAQSYSFELIPPGVTPYVEIPETSTPAEFIGTLDVIEELEGETFWFYDVPFTFGGLKTMAMGNAGYMRIDNDSSLIIIDGAFTYMDYIDNTSSMTYSIEGTSGHKIIRMQYRNMKLTSGEADNFVNLQIWYYQETGVVEVHYGPRSENNASGYTSTTGPHAGMFYSADDFSACYEKLWCTGNPNNPTLANTSNYNFLAMYGVPDEGTVFRFTPLFLINAIEVPKDIVLPRIYPNPTMQWLRVENLSVGTVIELADSYGRHINQFVAAQDNMQLDLSAYEAGLYYLSIQDGTGKYSLKVMVE